MVTEGKKRDSGDIPASHGQGVGSDSAGGVTGVWLRAPDAWQSVMSGMKV